MNYDYDDAEKLGIVPADKTAGTPNNADIPITSSTPGPAAGTSYTAYVPYNSAAPSPPAPVPPPAAPNHKVPPIPASVTPPGLATPERTPRETWSDPSYSAIPERGANVYSPGLAQPPYQQKQRPEHHEHEPSGGRRRGGFVRAACLVLVCALASAGATLGVLEYKGVGDGQTSPPTEASQPGATTPSPSELDVGALPSPDEGFTPTRPVANPGDALTAQEIYEMACRQVVVVKTDVVAQSNYFGIGGSSTVSGSGFIIKEDGYIVTNYHVVEAAYTGGFELTVTLYNGDVYPAIIIGLEKNNDVAVIKIEAEGLEAVSIGDSSTMRVGETVYAVGNPLGELAYTITDGIVSALDRDITVEGVQMNMFQISAAVNSGNSGGPVYDTYGNVLGMVTAKPNNSIVEGIGFAIPINDVMRISAQVMGHGYIVDSKAYFGIVPKTVDNVTAEYYGWVVGAYVQSITPGSCAERAGLKIGDIITKVGSIDVTSRDSLEYAKKCFNAGDTAEVTVWRAGESVTLTITFDEMPEQPEAETP